MLFAESFPFPWNAISIWDIGRKIQSEKFHSIFKPDLNDFSSFPLQYSSFLLLKPEAQ